MMFYGNPMGAGGWVLMVLSTLAFWALLIAAIVLAVRTLRDSRPSGTATTGSAEGILAERFARGEIDSDEYTQRLQTLRTAPPSLS